MIRRVFRLYARPSFLEGVARLLDVGSVLNEYNHADSPERADWIAIQSDWASIDQDLREAMAEFDKEPLAHAKG
jgi:hypothetical protein